MNQSSQNIKFIAEHHPRVALGDYKIHVAQSIKKQDVDLNPPFTTEMTFFVAGERFHLNPQDIAALFPPKHSLGEHSAVLPHISLNRSTLPWERFTDDDPKKTPWLALLLFNAHEADQSIKETTLPLRSLRAASNVSPYFPGLPLEKGQKETDIAAVIDVSKSTLTTLLPNAKALQLLTHVREATDANGTLTGEELAVIIANRLPTKGETSSMYLISVEKRFNSDGEFNYQGANDTDQIRLVSLKSWQFSCPEHYKVTEEFLTHASDLEISIKTKLKGLHGEEFFTATAFDTRLSEVLTAAELTKYKDKIYVDFAYGDFANTLKHLNRTPSNLRLPAPDGMNADNKAYLAQGFVPTAHYLRKGATGVSWYHGPLTVGIGKNNEPLGLPASAADQLLRYYADNGMLDISYAAAWELGRLLALQDKAFSKQLFNWKRSHIHEISKAEQCLAHQSAHLDNSCDLSSLDLPKAIDTWFDDLHRLKGVPFNYLVPREDMLPVESIRFFAVDPLWIESVVDGAFSIGRVTRHDQQRDKDHLCNKLKTTVTTTGFLLRSQVVSGWPGLQIEGFKKGSDNKLKPLNIMRSETLSEDVLFCLFNDELHTLDLHLKPEAMHFGVSVKDNGYEKQLKDSKGKNKSGEKIKVVFKKAPADRVVNIETLSTDMNATTADQFALQMVEGVAKVRFIATAS